MNIENNTSPYCKIIISMIIFSRLKNQKEFIEGTDDKLSTIKAIKNS
jgi:hypothetical protein